MPAPHDLEALASKGEATTIEFKESIAGLDGISKTVCAFANDINGFGSPGLILIGVDKDGRIVGTPSDDATLQKLAQLRVDGKITPTPSMTVTPVAVQGKTVIVLEVSPSESPPVRRHGIAYVRIGTTTTPATSEEERRLIEQRKGRALPFDARGISGSAIGDLDVKRFQLDYLTEAVNPSVLAENGRSVEQQLAALKLMDGEGRATPTGLLVVGIDPLSWLPGAYVQFRRIAGDKITDDTIDEARSSGTIDVIVRVLEEKLSAHNVTSLTIPGERHVKRSLYPITALQQIIRNAVMHRDYEISAPIRVTWFDDRIQIDNPGGPFQIQPDKLGEPGFTGYRNPNVAEAMHNMGLVERFGVGIPLARKALEDNGNPPLEIRADGNFVFVVMRAAR